MLNKLKSCILEASYGSMPLFSAFIANLSLGIILFLIPILAEVEDKKIFFLLGAICIGFGLCALHGAKSYKE